MWAIDNPDAFIAIVKGIERIVTISTDIFIGTIDFMGTVINEGYKLVDGFNDWTKENLGQDVADTFDDLGGKLVDFLNAGLIVGGLLLSRGQQELGEKPESPDKTKPEKSPTRKGPKKADKTTRTRRASQEARKRYARRYGKDAAKQRFGGKTRGPIKGSVTRRGLGRSVTRLGIKMNPAMVKNMKGIAKLAKGIKIPIIGPLVMGITSYLGDGNLGKAVFVALGTGIGELLGTAIPIPVVGTLLGGILGSFIGDLLYDIIVKKDPGAALKKVQDAAKKIFETGKAVFDWLKGSFGRFIETFKENNKLPIVNTTNWLALLDLTKTLPLLKDSFFPPQETPKTPNLGDFSGGSEGDKETSTGGSGATVQPQTAMITRLGSGAGSLKLTDQDYSDLAYIVSHEAARGTEDEYGVAAAVLNRVADPRYPDTIMGVGTAPGQFEAVFSGKAYRDDALAKQLKDNQGKIVDALKKLDGRTDFKAFSSMGEFMGDTDIMFADNGNFYHYAEQRGKTDPIPDNIPQDWKKLLGESTGEQFTASTPVSTPSLPDTPGDTDASSGGDIKVSGSGIVNIGKDLISKGFSVAEHPDFTKTPTASGGAYTPGKGSVSRVHKGRGHYEGRAIDVTDWRGSLEDSKARYRSVLTSLQNNPAINMLIHDSWGGMYAPGQKQGPGAHGHPTHMHIEVKDKGGFIGKGLFANLGGKEFVTDADSTAALGQVAPGLQMALNQARDAKGVEGVLQQYASYEQGAQQTVVVQDPPQQMPEESPQSSGGGMMAMSGGSSHDPFEFLDFQG